MRSKMRTGLLIKKRPVDGLGGILVQGERITYLHNKPCEQAMH